MKRISYPFLWIMLGVTLFSCSGNIYEGFNDPDSKKYKFDLARRKIDEAKFDEALDLLWPLYVDEPTNEAITYYYATAMLGAPGLRILDLIGQIATGISTKGLLEILADHYTTITDAQVGEFTEAIGILEDLNSDPVKRSGRVNFLILFAAWGKVGAVINRYAFDSNGTKLTDTFDACTISEDKNAARTGMPDSAVDEIMTSISRVIENAAVLSGSGAAYTAILGSSFPGLSSVGHYAIPCSTDSDNVTCLAVRTLVNLDSSDLAGAIGLGTGNFADNTLGTGACDDTVP